MNNFAITAADAVSRRYKSNDPEAIIAQRAIKIKDIPCLEIPRASAGLSIHAYRIRHP